MRPMQARPTAGGRRSGPSVTLPSRRKRLCRPPKLGASESQRCRESLESLPPRATPEVLVHGADTRRSPPRGRERPPLPLSLAIPQAGKGTDRRPDRGTPPSKRPTVAESNSHESAQALRGNASPAQA